MKLDGEDRRRILQEIHEHYDDPILGPDEFTAKQFAETASPPLTPYQATGKLRKLVETGVLSKRWVLHCGKWQWAFARANTGSVVASGNGATPGREGCNSGAHTHPDE